MNINDVVEITAVADYLESRGKYQWIDLEFSNQTWRFTMSQNGVFSIRNKTDEAGGSLISNRASLFRDFSGKSFKVLSVSPLDTARQSVIESKDKPTKRRKKKK
jgi:hypothetical protein